MRTVSGAQLTVLDAAKYEVHLRVEVESSGGSMANLSSLSGVNWVEGVKWDWDLDRPVPEMLIELRRDYDDGSITTLAPLSNGQIDVGRDFRVYTATVAAGAGEPTSGNFDLMFEGTLDDIDWTKSPIKATGRSQIMSRLADQWMQTSSGIYGSSGGTALETVIQDILNDHTTPTPTLSTPVSPSFVVTPEYQPEKQPVLRAVQTLAQMVGWDIREVYSSGSSGFELTLYEPDRTPSSVQHTFGADNYGAVHQMKVSREDVRNEISVIFGPTSSRAQVISESTASQDDYGHRWMEIEEASNSAIDTSSEAGILADAALADLKDPPATHEIELPYWWPAELQDYYGFSPNDIHYDSTQELGVYGISHELKANRHRTRIRVRGKPAGQYTGWYGYTGGGGGLENLQVRVKKWEFRPIATTDAERQHWLLDYNVEYSSDAQSMDVALTFFDVTSSGGTPAISDTLSYNVNLPVGEKVFSGTVLTDASSLGGVDQNFTVLYAAATSGSGVSDDGISADSFVQTGLLGSFDGLRFRPYTESDAGGLGGDQVAKGVKLPNNMLLVGKDVGVRAKGGGSSTDPEYTAYALVPGSTNVSFSAATSGEGIAISVLSSGSASTVGILDDLTDVIVAGPTTGQLLRYSTAGFWENDGLFSSDLPAIALDDLSDVVVPSPSTNDILLFSSSGGWKNSTNPGSTVGQLDDLSDVNLTSPSTNDFLQLSSSGAWVNAQLATTDLPALPAHTHDDDEITAGTGFGIPLLPSGDNTRDIGTGALRWQDFFTMTVTATTYLAVGADPATTGEVRLSNTDEITWRNAADSANLIALTIGADDDLTTAVDFVPNADGTLTLGTTGVRWQHIYTDAITVTAGLVTSVGEQSTQGGGSASGLHITPTAGAVLAGIQWTGGGAENFFNSAPQWVAEVLVGTDELLVGDAGDALAVPIQEMDLNLFDNTQGWTANAGTVTSVAAGTGIAASPSPITASGSIAVDILGFEDLTAPGADRIPFYDQTTTNFQWLTVGSGLTITGTTITTSGTLTTAGTGLDESPAGTVIVKYTAGSNLVDGAALGTIAAADLILFRDDTDGIVKKDAVSDIPIGAAQVTAGTFPAGTYTFTDDVVVGDGTGSRSVTVNGSLATQINIQDDGTFYNLYTNSGAGSETDTLRIFGSSGRTLHVDILDGDLNLQLGDLTLGGTTRINSTGHLFSVGITNITSNITQGWVTGTTGALWEVGTTSVGTMRFDSDTWRIYTGNTTGGTGTVIQFYALGKETRLTSGKLGIGGASGHYRTQLYGNTSDGTSTFGAMLKMSGTQTAASGDTHLFGVYQTTALTTQSVYEAVTEIAAHRIDAPAVTHNLLDTANNESVSTIVQGAGGLPAVLTISLENAAFVDLGYVLIANSGEASYNGYWQIDNVVISGTTTFDLLGTEAYGVDDNPSAADVEPAETITSAYTLYVKSAMSAAEANGSDPILSSFALRVDGQSSMGTIVPQGTASIGASDDRWLKIWATDMDLAGTFGAVELIVGPSQTNEVRLEFNQPGQVNFFLKPYISDVEQTLRDIKYDFSDNTGWTITLADGSETAPSLRFGSELDAGLFLQGTDNIGMAISGDLRFDWHTTKGFSIRHPTEPNFRLYEEDAAAHEGNYRMVSSSGDFYIQSLNDSDAVVDTLVRVRSAAGVFSYSDWGTSHHSPGRSSSWGSTSGIQTGAYNADMGVSSSATWAYSASSAGTFRGGMQILDTGTNASRFYLGTDYMGYTGNGTGGMQLRSGSIGSQTLPTYTWDGDPDSGLYMVGVGQVGITVGGVLACDWSTATQTLRYVGGGEMLNLRDTGGAGAAANPYIGFRDSANTRLGLIGFLVGGGTDDDLYIQNEDVDGNIICITDSGWLQLQSSQDEQLRLRHNSATGSPLLSWYRTTNRAAYMQFFDGGASPDELRVVSEDGDMVLMSGASIEYLRISSIDANEGGVKVDNAQFWVDESQTEHADTGTVTPDWAESNQHIIDFDSTSTTTTIAINDTVMEAGGSYVLLLQYNAGSAQSLAFTSSAVLIWANGTAPTTATGATAGDVTVVQFFKTTTSTNRIIGSWFVAT